MTYYKTTAFLFPRLLSALGGLATDDTILEVAAALELQPSEVKAMLKEADTAAQSLERAKEPEAFVVIENPGEGNEASYGPFYKWTDASKFGENETLGLWQIDTIRATTAKESATETVEPEDLFEHYEKQPQEVQDILAKYELEDSDYSVLRELVVELNSVGYTCEFGLDAEPFNLRKL